MSPNPNAADIKRVIKRLQSARGGTPDVADVLEKIAQDEGMILVLAQKCADKSEKDLRGLLSESATLMRLLHLWANPDAGKAVGSATEKPTETADREALPTTDDPSVLLRHDRVKVFVDGASKGNPGPSGVGIVVTNLTGETLYEEGRYVGEATNNVAEYRALITALKILLENGAPETFCFSDSSLVVNQLNGAWKVKNPGLMPFIAEAQALRRRLRGFEIRHIPREENSRADKLATLAVRQARDAARA